MNGTTGRDGLKLQRIHSKIQKQSDRTVRVWIKENVRPDSRVGQISIRPPEGQKAVQLFMNIQLIASYHSIIEHDRKNEKKGVYDDHMKEKTSRKKKEALVKYFIEHLTLPLYLKSLGMHLWVSILPSTIGSRRNPWCMILD